MTDLRNKLFKATGGAIVMAATAGIVVPGAANAADWSSLFLSTNKVEYIDNFREQCPERGNP